MSYMCVYDMAQDENLTKRIAGCVATQSWFSLPANAVDSPMSIAQAIQWQCAGQPGWDTAYSYAVENDRENPGAANDVITDGMILSAVQAVLDIGSVE